MANVPSREFRAAAGKRPAGVLLAAVLTVLAIPVLYALVSAVAAPHRIRYEVDTSSVAIVTAGGFTGDTKRILLSRIEGLSEAWLRGGDLRFGTVKTGYCVGFFRYPSIGEVWQATDCSESGVQIQASGEITPVIVTPADRDGFLDALKNARPGSFPAALEPSGVSWSLLATLLATLWPVAGVMWALFFLAPSRLRYRLSGGGLEVSTFMLRRRVPLAGTKARACQPLIGEKQSGVRVPGYYGGTFVLDEAPTAVFATSLDRGVLVEGDERLFVTPADERGFLAALATAGVTVA